MLAKPLSADLKWINILPFSISDTLLLAHGYLTKPVKIFVVRFWVKIAEEGTLAAEVKLRSRLRSSFGFIPGFLGACGSAATLIRSISAWSALNL